MNRSINSKLQAVIEGFELPSFLPAGLRSYAGLLVEGLVYFIERLPQERIAPILGEQAALSKSAAPIRIAALIRQSPTLHKLGQVVSRDRRLDPSLRERLRLLESMPASTPIAEIEGIVCRELGPMEFGRLRLHSPPIAEASVAVVVPFTWHHDGREAHGVFKVLRPGIEERLLEELSFLVDLGRFIEERCAAFGLPALDYRGTLKTVRDLLSTEIQLDHEQAHLRMAAEAFRDAPDVEIPALLPFSSPKLTSMTRIEGTTLSALPANDREAGRETARLIVENLILRPLLTADGEALFHADPHGGNLMLTRGGRLGVLDWSLAAHVSKSVREKIVQVVLGGAMLDVNRIARAIEALSQTPANEESLRRVVEQAVREVAHGTVPGLTWLTRLLDRAVLESGVRFDESLLLVRKALLTLDGLVHDLDLTCPVDAILLDETLRRLAAEWPARLTTPPFSRGFSTHLSTFDLAEMFWTGPWSVVRYWLARTP